METASTAVYVLCTLLDVDPETGQDGQVTLCNIGDPYMYAYVSQNLLTFLRCSSSWQSLSNGITCLIFLSKRVSQGTFAVPICLQLSPIRLARWQSQACYDTTSSSKDAGRREWQTCNILRGKRRQTPTILRPLKYECNPSDSCINMSKYLYKYMCDGLSHKIVGML